MLIDVGVGTLGVIVFLFIFWKRLNEDYSSEVIFQTAFSVLAGIFVALLLTNKFLPGAFFWTGSVGGLIGLLLAIFRFKVKFFESFEAFIISVLPWLGFVFLKDSVFNSSLSSFLGFIVILIMVFISYWLDSHYKNFTWFKSGRVGFAGLATLAFIFLIRSVVDILGISMLSFVAKYEAVLSGAAAFICFLLLFNLGRVKK